ncbi:MAG: helix-turn-helix transcriptional regulator [Candidatus Tumulicola sp.]
MGANLLDERLRGGAIEFCGVSRAASNPDGTDWRELRRNELARFLRARRELILPQDVGLPLGGRRRTPGLRREEVALLADIGAAWYTRLETGRDVKPSSATVLAIARALRLNVVETEYLFALAGVPVPVLVHTSEIGISEALEQLVPSIASAGAVICDHYVTALRWNAIADAMFQYSTDADPLQRNAIVRYVTRDRTERRYFGRDYDGLMRSLVGMFRKAFMSREATPFAQQVYAIAIRHPRFRKLWEDHVIAEDLFDTESTTFERHHPVVGRLTIAASNLRPFRHDDMFLRIIVPADDATADKFKRLRAMGIPSNRDTPIP